MTKLLKVDHVEVFATLLGGDFGPGTVCGSKDVYLLATTNEWKYRCQSCRARFNEAMEVLG